MKTIYIKSQKERDKLISKNLNDELEIIVQTPKEENLKINNTGKNWTVRIEGYVYSVYGSAQISNVYGSAKISNVSGSAKISYVSDSAQISYVSDSAQISNVYGSAKISNVYGSAKISNVYGYAKISSVSNYAQISNVYNSAKISNVYGYVNIYIVSDKAQIETFGHNTITYFKSEKNITIKASKNTQINKLESIRDNTSLDMYLSLYPTKKQGKNLIMYKTVHKINNEYVSNYDSNFKYIIGEIKEEKLDKNTDNSCSGGIHVSDKIWAINFGRRDDVALLECLVNPKDIVISKDCDGKVRCSKLKVIREVPKEERFI